MTLTRRSFQATAAVLVALLAWASGSGSTSGADRPDRTVQPAVTAPLPDGIRLDVPEGLGNPSLAAQGRLDVTAAPFNADPTGETDVTEALNRAITFARDHQMVCFFPQGTYRVSDTLHCTQIPARRTSGAVGPGRCFPCLLMGSYAGTRPRLVLAPRSPGFGDPESPKYLIHFQATSPHRPGHPQPNISMNQMLVNIDVVIGEGNSGAVGIRHRAAQGSAIQDTTVDATHGLTGIEGGIGSGGSIANVTVIGGAVGLDLRETQPVPVLVAVTLIHQRKAAIIYEGRQTLSGVGLTIVSKGPGPAILGLPAAYMAPRGQISLVDSRIVFENPVDLAIRATRSLYLQDVYIRNAKVAVADADSPLLPGEGDGWLRVRSFAHGVTPHKWRGYAYDAPVWIDGRRQEADLADVTPGAAPPADLEDRHRPQTPLPAAETGFNVRSAAPPEGAAGDGLTDDGPALQRAIDAHATVWLPKGYYRITEPLRLRPGTRLIGVGRHLSVIFVREAEGSFADPDRPRPLIRTADTAEASTLIGFCGIHVPDTVGGAYALNWRSGGGSVLRDVNLITRPIGGYGKPGKAADRGHPLVRVTGNGGGQWYNFFQESHRGQEPGYRHLLIEDAAGPLAIHACNPEHALGEANMEISRSAGISLYGLKSEGNRTVLRVTDSDRISVFGYGGNAAALPGESLFVFRRTPNFQVINAVDTPRLPPAVSPNPGFGRGVDPTRWMMIRDEPTRDTVVVTRPLDRPVLYRRGNPLPSITEGPKNE